jgi:SAM-dependent methyltransferase
VAGSLEITRKAANAAGVEVTTVCGDALGSPFPDGSFDVIFHQGLLEHFRDTTPLLRDNARLLKPGGHVIVDVPQTFHYYTVGKKILIAMDKWFAGWETQFTPKQLEELVKAEGLEVARTYGDWMVPGLWYRAVRKILLTRLGWKLPMMPFWIPIGEGWRQWFSTKRLSLYTTPTIGVVARKPQREAAS